MRGRSLYVLVTLAVTATALSLAAAGAQAGNPQVNHFEFSFDFTWNDFCGTGAEVQVSGDYHGTEFLDPNQPVDERVLLEGKTVYLNPANDKKATLHIADQTWSTTISGDPNGLHVVESTTKGVGASFRAEPGGTLIRDAGEITVRETYDGEDFISREILLDHGGHPILEGDFFPVLCSVVPDALELT